LDLGDGYQFQLIGVGSTQARVANPKTIYLNVALKNDKLAADNKKMIEAADRLFESVLMGPAEKGYYKNATVNIRKAGTAAATVYEDFVYARGENEVWLRQAGNAPWKVAQEVKWTPPAADKIDVPGFGTFAVEAAVEIEPPEGFKRAAEIDFVTPTPVIELQRKYQEIKALWAMIDQAQMKADGFDVVLIGNFQEAQKGRFHARKGFFVRIPRPAGGDWLALPDRAPEDQETLISKLDIPADSVANAIRLSFAGGASGVRLAGVMPPASTAVATDATTATFTHVAFAPPISVTAETRRINLAPLRPAALPLTSAKPAAKAKANIVCHFKCTHRGS
jgi:hypothetical protein